MSIEQTIERLAKAIEAQTVAISALTSAVLSRVEQPVVMPATTTPTPTPTSSPSVTPQQPQQQQANETTSPSAPTTDSGVSLDDIRNVIKEISKSHKDARDRVRVIFQGFSAEKLSDIKESQYEAFLEKLCEEFKQ